MDLMQLIQQLFTSEAEMQKRREAYARRLNELAFRNRQGPNKGNPIAQGDGGVYSDSMPFTIEDFFRTHKPGFYNYMNNQNPVTPSPETSLKPANPYQGLML